jgi:hypothetical protein
MKIVRVISWQLLPPCFPGDTHCKRPRARPPAITLRYKGKDGAAERNRTSDPVITNDVLYH